MVLLLRPPVVLLAVMGLFTITSSCRDPERATEVTPLDADAALARLKRLTHRKNALIATLAGEPLFAPNNEVLRPPERARLKGLFADVVDVSVSLEQMARHHRELARVDPTAHPKIHAGNFALGFAAHLAHLEVALSFVDRTMNRAHFERLLDEGDPTRGLPARAYETLKYNAIHVEDASMAVAFYQYHKGLNATLYPKFKDDNLITFSRAVIDDIYPRVFKTFQRHGVKLFASNAFDIVKDKGLRLWFPLQSGVAEWMGDTKVAREGSALIHDAEIKKASAMLEPGDVLIERRNWYVSNVGLPGFWPHAALYVGDAPTLRAYFDTDETVTAAFGVPLSAHLEKTHPLAWARFTSKENFGPPPRVIEAISEGVSFTTLEHSLHCDYAAALRPKLSKLDKARAISRAFGFAFLPYDFDFDFLTDESLVCSELVFKSYEAESPEHGLRYQLESVMGRKTLAPNTMVQRFDERFGEDHQQLDFVFFLDAREDAGEAFFSDVRQFRASHRRPKWDILQP